MYTFVFPKNLQFYPPGKTPDVQVNMRTMQVMPDCLQFPYENTRGTKMMWRVTGVNIFLLESRIQDGRMFRFKVGSVMETIETEAQTINGKSVLVDKPAQGLEDVRIETVEHISNCSSESKYWKETIPLAPLTTAVPEWLFCIDTGYARYWHHRDDLDLFATRKIGAKEQLLEYRGDHNYIFTPLVKKNPGDYDTFDHILANNFSAGSTNYLCPDSFEHEGVVISTASFFPENFDRYRVEKVKHKLGNVSANSEWSIIFNNPKADARKKAQQIQRQVPRGMDM